MMSRTIQTVGKVCGRGVGVSFLLIFGLFCSGMTLAFDGFIAWGAWRQFRALTYSTATGRITHSEVEESGGEDGPTYRPNLKYKYHVADREYQGSQYRYGQWSSGDRNAQRIAIEYPVGREVVVYHNPNNPSDAVLIVGMEGCDLFLAMFILPFNLVMLGTWIAAGASVYQRLARPPAGGVKIWDDGFRVRLRLSLIRPLYVGATAAGGLAFAGVFIVGFAFGFNPSMPIMLSTWGLILGGGAGTYLYQHGKLSRGHFDLVIDDIAQTLSLPRTKDRQTETVVPIRCITSVEVQQIEKRTSDGNVHSYVPVLVFADETGPVRREKLIEWWDQARAEELAAWLRERLRIAPPRGDAG